MKAVGIVLLILIAQVASHCPSGCSGHGSCNNEDTCDCFAGFDGFPDCSGRK